MGMATSDSIRSYTICKLKNLLTSRDNYWMYWWRPN